MNLTNGGKIETIKYVLHLHYANVYPKGQADPENWRSA